MRREYTNEGSHTEKIAIGGEELSATITGHSSLIFEAEPSEEIEVFVYGLHGYEDGESYRSGTVEELTRSA
jgi:hypothetical protein